MVLDWTEYENLARKAVQEGVVLLRNEKNVIERNFRSERDRNSNKIEELKRYKKRLSKETRNNAGKIALWIGIMSLTVFGSNKLIDHLCTEYKTTIEEYDQTTDEVNLTEEYTQKKPGVELTVY